LSCKICDHAKRREIEKDIVSGLSLRAVADKYDGFSYQAVRVHKATCIPKAIAASKNGKKIIKFHAKAEELMEADSINLVSDLLSLRNIVRDVLDKFRNIEEGLELIEDPVDAGRLAVAKSDMLLKAIDRMVKVLDLYARISGEVEGEKHLHLHNHPDVMGLMRKVYAELEKYPKALEAVTLMMEGVGA